MHLEAKPNGRPSTSNILSLSLSLSSLSQTHRERPITEDKKEFITSLSLGSEGNRHLLTATNVDQEAFLNSHAVSVALRRVLFFCYSFFCFLLLFG